MKLTGKTVIGATLGAVALAFASPAMARDHYRGDRGGDDAAIAIGAGLIGLAIGAAIASDNDDRYYDRRYYGGYYGGGGYYYPQYRGRYVYRDYPRYDRRDYRRSYRHDRHDYDRRDYRRDYRRGGW